MNTFSKKLNSLWLIVLLISIFGCSQRLNHNNTDPNQFPHTQAGLSILSVDQAPSIYQVGTIETWVGDSGGSIGSTDPAGITYVPSRKAFIISDSEINEIEQWTGSNLFEISNDFNTLIDSYATSVSRKEPTGISYNEYNGKFYITNDDNKKIYQYSSLSNSSYDKSKTTGGDPEGITSDPETGFLYVADGNLGGKNILVYDANLEYQYKFDVSDYLNDPEGIAFDPDRRDLFIISGMTIARYTRSGKFLAQYSISNFIPPPIAPQGLTFAPSSYEEIKNLYT